MSLEVSRNNMSEVQRENPYEDYATSKVRVNVGDFRLEPEQLNKQRLGSLRS